MACGLWPHCWFWAIKSCAPSWLRRNPSDLAEEPRTPHPSTGTMRPYSWRGRNLSRTGDRRLTIHNFLSIFWPNGVTARYTVELPEENRHAEEPTRGRRRSRVVSDVDRTVILGSRR